MKQKVAITFELEETVVLKQGAKKFVDFCPRCQANVEMISPDALALLSRSSEREIFRLIETGVIHFTENQKLFVCPVCYRSLFENGVDQHPIALNNGELPIEALKTKGDKYDVNE